jgi:hypothetical protein
MAWPGDVALIATAMAIINGARRTIPHIEPIKSIDRFVSIASPRKVRRNAEIAGIPAFSAFLTRLNFLSG